MAPLMNKFTLPARYVGSDRNVWLEYLQLALEHKPVNLGLGFPDFLPAENVIKSLESMPSNEHQYTHPFGHPRLVNVLAKLYSNLIGRQIDPETEILITPGAQGALHCSIFGHIDVGDEAIIIEPYFDCYAPTVRAAGGIPRFVPLRLVRMENQTSINSSDFTLNPIELENSFNDKTKMIILNTPHNPLGKVFTNSELETIARLCKKWNALCISDEVYEWMVFKPAKHIRIATLPGMFERTITIGSGGKTFSATGWRVGWAYGAANLIRNMRIVHQNCVYSCITPMQEAIAMGFEKELDRLDQDDCYLTSLAKQMSLKRDYMAQFLTKIGMIPIIPLGGYFMVANWSPLATKVDLNSETDRYEDYRFTKWMTKNVGVQGIPVSAFYNDSNKKLGEPFVRYCFIKTDENLKKAGDILRKWHEHVDEIK